MKMVAVIEGFSGGPMHTRAFRRAVRQAGFSVVRNYRKADIIVAHSAGIYAIPPDVRARVLVLIGPTYWPGRKLIKRVFAHTKSGRLFYVKNYGWWFYIWKKALELYYFFRRHRYLWLGVKNNNKLDRLYALAGNQDRQIILVRNHDDSFCDPAIGELFKGRSNVRYVELPGVHEDYTTNPKPYIKLMEEARE